MEKKYDGFCIWGKAKKKPVIISYREPIYDVELITTREGELRAYKGKDYVIMGIRGEIYPIGRDIFEQTYEVIEPIHSSNQKVIE